MPKQSDVAAAWQQAESVRKESDGGVIQVPAGDMLGGSDREKARIMELATGGTMDSEDERIGGPPQTDETQGAGESPPPSHEVYEEETQTPPPQQDLPPQEEVPPPSEEPEVDQALMDLFAEDDLIDADGEVDIGGKKYTGAQIRAWQEAANQSERLQEEYREKERRLETAAQMMINDPKAALEATGSMDKLMKQLRDDGLLSEQAAQRDEVPFDGNELDDEGEGRHVRALVNELRAQRQQLEELRNRSEQRDQEREQRDFMTWRQGRLDVVRKHLNSMLEGIPTLRGPMGEYLSENVFLKCREDIDQAPTDPSGLKTWAKDRLKQEVQRSGILSGKRTTPPKPKTTMPAKAGETPAEPANAAWDKADVSDDDERRRASLAWLNYYAES